MLYNNKVIRYLYYIIQYDRNVFWGKDGILWATKYIQLEANSEAGA